MSYLSGSSFLARETLEVCRLLLKLDIPLRNLGNNKDMAVKSGVVIK